MHALNKLSVEWDTFLDDKLMKNTSSSQTDEEDWPFFWKQEDFSLILFRKIQLTLNLHMYTLSSYNIPIKRSALAIVTAVLSASICDFDEPHASTLTQTLNDFLAYMGSSVSNMSEDLSKVNRFLSYAPSLDLPNVLSDPDFVYNVLV